jgi:hypothetical protein
VYEDEWVVVDVDHASGRVGALSDFVSIRGDRDTGTDVEELADAAVGGKVAGHPASESAILDRCDAYRWERRRKQVAGGAVGGEVVLAAEPVVVATSLMGNVDVKRFTTTIADDGGH